MTEEKARSGSWVLNLALSFLAALVLGLGVLWDRAWEFWGWGWRKGLGWDPRLQAVVVGLAAFVIGFVSLQLRDRKSP